MRAISSMATRHVLTALLNASEAAGLTATTLESVGGIDAARRVRSGEGFDLVFLADPAIRELADDGLLSRGTITPLVLSQVAVAVRSEHGRSTEQIAGTAYSDGDEFFAALLDAERIGYSTGPSGTELLRMIRERDLGDLLEPRLVQARPGVPVASLLADGDADLGLQQLSELVGQPGIRVLGVLPPDCAIDTVFSGAVSTAATDPAGAAAVLSFLASAVTAPIKAAYSFAAA